MTIEQFRESPILGYVFDPNLKNEANANNPESITLGPKFFDLDAEGRKHVISHEKAHYLVDEVLSSPDKYSLLFDLVDSGAFGPKDDQGFLSSGINGQYTPLENLTEAFSVYDEDPDWLKENYPGAFSFVYSIKKENDI